MAEPRTVVGISLAAPAAGAEVSFVPSTKQHWRISSLYAVLTTSATVNNRLPHLQIKDAAGVVVADMPAYSVLTASAFLPFTWLPYWPNGANGTNNYDGVSVGPCPGNWWPPGWSINTKTTGLESTDAWSAIVAVLEVEDFLSDES